MEGNKGDIKLTMKGLKEKKIVKEISIVRKGEQAIQFLNKGGDYNNVSRPDFILLDINLPRIDGNEKLSYIKKNRALKSIRDIVLSTSTSEKDIAYSYNNHVNSYV